MHLFFKGSAIQNSFNLPVFIFSCLILVSSGFSIAQPRVSHSPQSASVKPVEKKLKAQGRQQTVLNINRFGRYAILTDSEQGSAVQYIDRMAGPSAIMGYAGETNGRIDAFLDKGDYKIITLSHDKGEGEVELRVVASRELNSTPTQLIDYKLIESELGDFQQRSWWIDLKHRKTIILEAAGRSLADLRIWKDGNWLVADKPVSEVIEPSVGKPLLAQRMIVDLNPGLYLLSAYGGPAQPWAETSTANPLYLRMGIPPVAQSGRVGQVISPFGIDRWRVPAQSDYYRLELEASAAASMTVGDFEEISAFDGYNEQRYIDKKSLVPVAEIKTYTRDTGFKLVSVQAQAGTPYILQHFLM
ncbi:hypothetical protein MNBD_GAMMA10-2498, partial [hydrothermal vent metagenome]